MIKVSTCNLNQWALDFDANLDRVKESIRVAKAGGAIYRLGPELELSGYGCEDHFLESDTLLHCDESLADILASDLTDGILCDIGMPVLHHGVRYNCRVLCLDRKILLICPKTAMADDGNYRETRYFTCWPSSTPVENHTLSPLLTKATAGAQTSCPFGVAMVEAFGTTFGCETCEELWTPESPHIALALSGCEVVGNGSGSHHQLRKLDRRVDLITGASKKSGGVYLYSNQRGCDGSRLYFDGGSMVVKNGRLLAQAQQFSVKDVEVVFATVDLDDVRSYRASISSMQAQAALAPTIHRVVCVPSSSWPVASPLSCPTPELPQGPRYHTPEEECAFGPACWLWDYLRRSGASGFFLPLSGGADSGAVAAIVGTMCELVAAEVRSGNSSVTADALRVIGRLNKAANAAGAAEDQEEVSADDVAVASDPKQLANHIFHSCYMGTSHSSEATRSRASNLATQIGAYHSNMEVDAITSAVVSVFARFVSGGKEPQFLSKGGTLGEDLALQNIQARVRMVMAYLSAQLLPWVRGRKGFLLVLGSANVDEGLRGYMTKYDCSSADLCPIGSISKLDLKRVLKWAAHKYGYEALLEIEGAPPTAELRPDDEKGVAQTDEEDMGMSYEELGWYGRLRKIDRCGPLAMFKKLVRVWGHKFSPKEVAQKVKFFFRMYSINRHKMTTLTPAYHAESYSPCDNRFDLRQFLYNVSWPRQSRAIDAFAQELEDATETSTSTSTSSAFSASSASSVREK